MRSVVPPGCGRLGSPASTPPTPPTSTSCSANWPPWANHERTARFRTVALVRFPDGHEVVAEGWVDGSIAAVAAGEHGFGYDPVFVPAEGDGRTFAEMTPAEKHALSHRGRAFRALAEQLVAEA